MMMKIGITVFKIIYNQVALMKIEINKKLIIITYKKELLKLIKLWNKKLLDKNISIL